MRAAGVRESVLASNIISGREAAVNSTKLLLCLAICGLSSSSYLVAQDRSAPRNSRRDEVRPGDVFVDVAVVRAELEQIRFLMGRPPGGPPIVRVSSAAPHEVYFQALALWRKADRLCFEQTRQREPEPDLPAAPIQMSDVKTVVKMAQGRLSRIKQQLDIDEPVVPPSSNINHTATDVFHELVYANRQVNLLLDRQFAPEDVFQQVTVAVAYAARLLETHSRVENLPDPPAHEPGKRPVDVYRRLIECFPSIQRIAAASGLSVCKLQVEESMLEEVEPSDVYDLASLVVAELAYLHSRADDAQVPREVYYSGRKFPSHVFQRAGLLQQQLVNLEALTKRSENQPTPD